MAINTLADWRANGAHARQSILGRPRRKDERREPDGEDDEVQRSPATEHHIQTFFDALQAGDAAEQSHALAKIVDTWRADNNAGGLPVYAHQPLPSGFANELAKVVQSGVGKSAAESLATKLEPGARLSVFQQLRGVVSDSARDTAHQNAVEPFDTVPSSGLGLSVSTLGLTNEVAAEALKHRAQSTFDQEEPEARTASAQQDRFATLQLDDTDPKFENARYTDPDGKVVRQAWLLPDGTILPPAPSFNKVLPIHGSVNARQRPQGYASGAFDPDAIGLRIDRNTGKYAPHHGIDFHARYGEPARVAADGVVVAVGNATGYGRIVAVRHPDGTMTMYAHLDPTSVRVRPGQFIQVGTIVGGAGTSGNAPRPQVHFEVWREAYMLGPNQLDFARGKKNLVDPYAWYDQPMFDTPMPRQKPYP